MYRARALVLMQCNAVVRTDPGTVLRGFDGSEARATTYVRTYSASGCDRLLMLYPSPSSHVPSQGLRGPRADRQDEARREQAREQKSGDVRRAEDVARARGPTRHAPTVQSAEGRPISGRTTPTRRPKIEGPRPAAESPARVQRLRGPRRKNRATAARPELAFALRAAALARRAALLGASVRASTVMRVEGRGGPRAPPLPGFDARRAARAVLRLPRDVSPPLCVNVASAKTSAGPGSSTMRPRAAGRRVSGAREGCRQPVRLRTLLTSVIHRRPSGPSADQARVASFAGYRPLAHGV
ncbi:uncharacterized protein B0H18DRAFT_456589 [Fomitopsis serialis]|uniref:uncharacterized protein n=1 Tax=Fomitopsis serialis TaxID=139415 RepID=UPI002008A50E|nr:uncharacterized protein B0H18DRAFT_456589 [Neoantrodia serialis]KAH9923607.1 hypothetical protein B0H18DRAFT_456589 [Neoantrodia serialis]